uniref:Myosin light chain kinase, smooth muscle-like n=2 Tax=Clastoptera arizonana TaxID=38151 RepID=A0A1B6CDT2_9HEMI
MTLNPEGRAELALARITPRDAGVYMCTAANAVGRTQTTCHVTVRHGPAKPATPLPTLVTPSVPYTKEPKFIMKPRSTEAVEGDTVVIVCEVVGDPKPEVVWLRDWLKPGYYRDAPQFRIVGEGPQYRLEIPQVKLDFTGTYTAHATNPHGEAKAIISLQIYAKGQGKESSMVSGQVKHGTVHTLPEIIRELKDLRCCDGDSVTLECRVQSIPTPNIRWERGGRLIHLGGDWIAEQEGDVARLTIQKVYPEDEGEYTCVAYNDLGRAVTSACIVVDVPEEKENQLSQQLSRPPGLLSAESTPRSTPRSTPSRSSSPRLRDFSLPSGPQQRRVRMASPKFYTFPHNRVAEEGETIRFQCSVAGHPTPWASWDKDGSILTLGTRLTIKERDDMRILELREVTMEDAGLYRVTLENEMGSVEATARLDVVGRNGSRARSVRAYSASRASPTFGRRLVGSAARVGGTFTLACDVHASPSPITSWYRNGELVVLTDKTVPSWDGRIARLELRDLELEDGGVYTCVAENEVGTTRCSAELVVLDTTDPSDADLRPPMFLKGLEPEVITKEGTPLELQTRLHGTLPIEVVWVRNGIEIPDCEDFRHVDYGDGRFGLRIADIFIADSGTYNCEAFNLHGDAITSGRLLVKEQCTCEENTKQEPIENICFTEIPKAVVSKSGGAASFCARLQCPPHTKTTFSWSVNGKLVTNDSSRFKIKSEDNTSTLHLTNISRTDEGTITCTAKVISPDSSPTTVSCSSMLTLEMDHLGSPASIVRGPADTTAMRGDRVMLKATYKGCPEPSVRWLKAGRELSSSDRLKITTSDGVSCLQLGSITADDSGKYVVSVENLYGADCHFASVAVEGPPEPPAGHPSAVRSDDTSVSVAWSSPPYDGGCVLTGYRVEMKTDSSEEWGVVAERCHSLSRVIRNLTTGQVYTFRVRAENIHGASEPSLESNPIKLGHNEQEEEEEDDDLSSQLEPFHVEIQAGDEFVSRYTVHEELGKGRYGVVHKVTDQKTGNIMAAKFVRCIKKQDKEKVQEEIDIMNCLHHPKLLQLVGAFENPKDIVMIMEYISGGELFERVVADDFTLTEKDCIIFMRQICEGVEYMHNNFVVHLDLKPENIMCRTRTSHKIKLIDFGLAQKLKPDSPVRVLFGTPEFIPPEIINYEPIGVESDMWSVGVICYVLLSGLSPFMGDNDAETFANITRADYDFDDEAFDAISQDAKDFISSLLEKRREKRLTAHECLNHQWMTQCDKKNEIC